MYGIRKMSFVQFQFHVFTWKTDESLQKIPLIVSERRLMRKSMCNLCFLFVLPPTIPYKIPGMIWKGEDIKKHLMILQPLHETRDKCWGCPWNQRDNSSSYSLFSFPCQYISYTISISGWYPSKNFFWKVVTLSSFISVLGLFSLLTVSLYKSGEVYPSFVNYWKGS